MRVPSSAKIGYAVVGLGSIAETAVIPAFGRASGCQLRALVSHDKKRAARLATRFRVKQAYGYEEYDRCLANGDVDAVFIASVNGAHADQAVRAASAGKHVLCEKPMANSVEECRQMVEACQSNRVRLMIAYRKYFEPASVALKRLIDRGKLGRLKMIYSTYTENVDPAKAQSWQLKRNLAGGGSLMDLGIYCVNTMRWIAGNMPLEAHAESWTEDPERFSEVEDTIAFRLSHRDGLVCLGSSSFSAVAASFLQVHGEHGWAALNPAFPFDEERRLFGKLRGKWFEQRFKVIDEFALELDAFADCIRRRRNPEADGMEGLRDLAVIEAIYRSSEQGVPVPVSQI
jgi:predicted dehydrogenase